MPTFSYTGGQQTWVVPTGVIEVQVECWGAEGGQGLANSAAIYGGYGGYAKGLLSVTPGETLYIFVGGRGPSGTGANGWLAAGYNGGGQGYAGAASYAGGSGGGASDVRQGGTALGNRRIVAGGGGGAGDGSNGQPNQRLGGAGGGTSGSPTAASSNPSMLAAGGGTQTAGGIGGAWSTSYSRGETGVSGRGGNATSGGSSSGGGGGGWWGGGGSTWIAGGGGSGYIGGVTSGTMSNGVRGGHGQVVITILNDPPAAPTHLSPNGSHRDPRRRMRWSWRYSDPDGDPQTYYQLRWRAKGTTAWTTGASTASSNHYHDWPAKGYTLTLGNEYEWEVRTYDGKVWGAWSATASFLAAASSWAEMPAISTSIQEWGIPTGTSYERTVLTGGPVGYWRFGESSGATALDSSPSSLHGTYSGTPSLGQRGAIPGDPDTAVAFPGSSRMDVAETPLLQLTVYTYEFWVKATAATGSWRRLLGKGDGAVAYGRGPGIWFHPSTTQLHNCHSNADGTQTVVDSSALSVGVWTHVAVTLSADRTMRVYLNGTLNASGVIANPVAVMGTLDVGTVFDGPIDELSVYDRALTPAEVASRADPMAFYRRTVLKDGPIGYWRMDQTSGASVDQGSLANGSTNASPTGTVTPDQDGPRSGTRAVAFGGGHYSILNAAHLQTLHSQSIEFWIHPTSLGDGVRRNPWNKAYGGEGTITQEPAGSLSYYWGTAGGNAAPYQGFSSGNVLTSNAWHHCVLVRDLEGDFDTADRNLLNYSTWQVGEGGAPGFPANGAATENYRIADKDPTGRNAVLWEARPGATSDADGGWNGDFFAIDPTKLYRFSVWVRRTVMGNGHFYLGTNGGGAAVLNKTNGAANSNPYFWYSGAAGEGLAAQGEWMLVVGHIWPAGTAADGARHSNSGRWAPSGAKVGDTSLDFIWDAATTSARHRSYLYYSTDTATRQQWVYPRVDVVDGTEPPLGRLIANPAQKFGRLRWYINGVEAAQATAADYGKAAPSGNAILIGAGYTNPYAGRISEVALYDYALSPEQVTSHYEATPFEMGKNYLWRVRTADTQYWGPWSSEQGEVAIQRVLSRTTDDAAPASDAVQSKAFLSRTTTDSAPAVETETGQQVNPLPPSFIQPIVSPVFSYRDLTFQDRVASDSAPVTDSASYSMLIKRSGADTASASDTASRSLVSTRSVPDAAPASDTATRTTSLPRSGGDGVGGGDAVTRQQVVSRSPSDTASASDAAAAIIIFSRTTADSAPASDTATRTTTHPRTVGDSAPATDDGTRSPSTFARAGGDTLTTSDAATRSNGSFTRAPGDTAPASDGATRYAERERTAADSTSASDAVSSTAIHRRTLSDSAPAADAVEHDTTLFRSPTDSAPAEDAATRYVERERTATDSAPADDAPTHQATLRRATNEWLHVVQPPRRSLVRPIIQPVFSEARSMDVGVKSALLKRTSSDSASASDAATRTVSYARSASDSTPATDVAQRGTSYVRSVGDTAPATDSVASPATHSRTAADALPSVGDTATYQVSFFRGASDVAPVSDDADRATLHPRSASDVVPATDAATRSANRERTAGDVAPATDAATRYVARSRTADDVAGVGDYPTSYAILLRQPTDVSPASDTPTHDVQRGRTGHDEAPSSDGVARSFTGSRATTDAAPATDVATRVAPKGRTGSDSAPAADAVERTAGTFARTIGDSAPATDDGTRNPITFHRSASETLVTTDSATRSEGTFSRTSADIAPAEDVTTKKVLRTHHTSDEAPAVDAAERQVGYQRDSTDDTSVGDQATRSVFRQRTAADAASSTDVVTHRGVYGRQVDDHVPATDAAERAILLLRSAADVVGGWDTPRHQATHIRSLGDAAPASDGSAHLVFLFRRPQDSAPASDEADRLLSTERTAVDAAPATDAVLAPVLAPRTGVEVLPEVTDGATIKTWQIRLAPKVTITSLSRTRLSREEGSEFSTVTFAFDIPVSAWAVRVGSTSHLDGTLAEWWEGDPTLFGLAVVPSAALQPGENLVTIYARSVAGVWSR